MNKDNIKNQKQAKDKYNTNQVEIVLQLEKK